MSMLRKLMISGKLIISIFEYLLFSDPSSLISRTILMKEGYKEEWQHSTKGEREERALSKFSFAYA